MEHERSKKRDYHCYNYKCASKDKCRCYKEVDELPEGYLVIKRMTCSRFKEK